MIQTAQGAVETPQVRFIESVADIPAQIQKMVEVPVVQTAQNAAEILEVQLINRVIDVPAQIQRMVEVPMSQTTQNAAEIPQVQFIDRVIGVPAPIQKMVEVPMIQTALGAVEKPQVRSVDRVVDAPCRAVHAKAQIIDTIVTGCSLQRWPAVGMTLFWRSAALADRMAHGDTSEGLGDDPTVAPGDHSFDPDGSLRLFVFNPDAPVFQPGAALQADGGTGTDVDIVAHAAELDARPIPLSDVRFTDMHPEDFARLRLQPSFASRPFGGDGLFGAACSRQKAQYLRHQRGMRATVRRPGPQLSGPGGCPSACMAVLARGGAPNGDAYLRTVATT